MSELLRVVSSLVAVGLYALAGWGITELVPGLRRRSASARLGFAYLLGTAVVGLAAYAASHFLGVRLTRTAVLACLLVPILAGVVARLKSRREPPAPRRPFRPEHDLLPRVVIVAAAFTTTALLVDGVATPVTDWDGRMTWCTQARYIRGDRSVNASAIIDPRWDVSHPRYPVLLPLLQVLAQEVFDAPLYDDRFVRPIYGAYYLAFVLLIFDGAARLSGRRAASWAALLALGIRFFAFDNHGGAAGTYSDFPLACYWGAGVLLLTGRGRTLATGIAAGVLLGAGVLTKNEGLPLAVAGLAAGLLEPVWAALARWRRPGTRKAVSFAPAVAAAIMVAAAVVLLLSWRSHIPNRNDENYEAAFRAVSLGGRLVQTAPIILRSCLAEMADLGRWGLFWGVAALVALAGFRGLKRRAAVPLLVALGGAFGTYFMAYVVTGWPLEELIRVTFSRFLQQMALPTFALLSLCLRRVLSTGRDVPIPPPA